MSTHKERTRVSETPRWIRCWKAAEDALDEVEAIVIRSDRIPASEKKQIRAAIRAYAQNVERDA